MKIQKTYTEKPTKDLNTFYNNGIRALMYANIQEKHLPTEAEHRS